MNKIFAFISCVIVSFSLAMPSSFAQQDHKQQWVDSVMASLSPNERIAQLMVIRTSGMDKNGDAVFYDKATDSLVSKYNVGAVCLFQGSPDQQASLLNRIQSMAKTPIMVTVDGEWGLGMRFKGVESFPYQLTMGAVADAELVYAVGKAIAAQCRRMNIHVNYAPVVDINNNPANPVIGVRSFGEDKYKVALMGTRIMEGMQDNGIMACAKHFPGHGDVSVDSHYDLPVINKSMPELEALELYPFEALFRKGVGSVMVAHLYIPAIDQTANRATSLSPQNVNGLLRNTLGYNGLSFTDALEMQGVAKFFPGGEASVQSIIAGNDMLCLPGDVPKTIDAVNEAIAAGRLKHADIDNKCRRVLEAKYDYVYGKTGAINTTNLLPDLNAQVSDLRRKVAEKAFTVLKQAPDFQQGSQPGNKVYVMLSAAKDINFESQLTTAGYKVYWANVKSAVTDEQRSQVMEAARQADQLVIGIHSLNRSPSSNFGIDASAIRLINDLGRVVSKDALMLFGNPYALGKIDAASYATLAVAYEDDAIFRTAGYQWLSGSLKPEGTLPVTVGEYQFGSGMVATNMLPVSSPSDLGMNLEILNKIDDIAREGIREKAYPGCVVAVVKDGKMAFKKAYGTTTYDKHQDMTTDLVFDMASVTKTSATTIAVMQLYEQGKLALTDSIGKFLPFLRNSDKANLTVENLLLHQAGLVAWIPFYKAVINAAGKPFPVFFSAVKHNAYNVDVTEQLYMRRDYVDSMYKIIADSKLETEALNYVYSDNDFILLALIVQAISGERIDAYARRYIYEPLGLHHTGFQPYKRFPLDQLVPTENEILFRRGLIRGYVHDPGAAMFGNVAGHAGLFSTVDDLSILYQMLLNGGEYNGVRLLDKKTVDYFTAYHTPISRRGLGWDKPSKNNAMESNKSDAYPAYSPSIATYGHTGYTGTCVWSDPEKNVLYIFLSNRVNPNGGENRQLLSLNIRGRIHDLIYESLEAY